VQTTLQFLRLLDEDIRVGNVKKIPDSVLNRINAIKQKAYLARTKKQSCELV
jgi:hypothetical protein